MQQTQRNLLRLGNSRGHREIWQVCWTFFMTMKKYLKKAFSTHEENFEAENCPYNKPAK